MRFQPHLIYSKAEIISQWINDENESQQINRIFKSDLMFAGH